MSTPTVTAVVGNPRQGSRTHGLTATVTDQLTKLLGADDVQTVDLAALGAALLDPSNDQARAARERVAGSGLLIVATPVYKATYTGLLKLFLDGYGNDGLAGVTALGVIVSGNPAHLLSADIHLRSLLVELGASVPTRSLGITEAQLPEAERVVGDFAAASAGVLRRILGVADHEEVTA